MSLQHESHTVQTVSQTEDSPPRLPISRRLSVIFEKVKAEMASSSWILVLHTISWWLLGLTLIIAVSVFTYLALYISLMPSEVKLFKIIILIVLEAVILAGFRFMKKTSISSSWTALTDPDPAVIPTRPSSWTRGDTS